MDLVMLQDSQSRTRLHSAVFAVMIATLGLAMAVFIWPVAGRASGPTSGDSYVDVEILMDNSSSMTMGATEADMTALMNLSACDPSNAVFARRSVGDSLTPYSVYAYASAGNVYHGPQPMPLVVTGGADGPITMPQLRGAGFRGRSPSCEGWLPKQANGAFPLAGPPCAMACHWDAAQGSSGRSRDLYGMARRTIGTANPVMLRFDMAKISIAQILKSLAAHNVRHRNVRVGLFTFSNTVSQIYPKHQEAGEDLQAAIAELGAAPTGPYVNETGIQPAIGLRQNRPNGNTDFRSAAADLLHHYLITKAGDGAAPSTPRKVIVIVTDGFEDVTGGPHAARAAIDPAECAGFKQLGYTVFVVGVPYYPVIHIAYLDSFTPIAEGDGPGTLRYNLRACASSPDDYLSVADGTAILTAAEKMHDPM